MPLDNQQLQQLLNQGLSSLNQACLNEAEANFKTILNQLPNHAKTLHFLAHVKAKRGNHDQAIQLGEKSLLHGNADIQLKIDLGFWYNAISKHQDALRVLIPIKNKVSKHASAQAHLGNAYRRTNQHDKGLQHALNAVRIAVQNFNDHWIKVVANFSQYIHIHRSSIYGIWHCQSKLRHEVTEANIWYGYIKIYKQDTARSLFALNKLAQSWLYFESRDFQSEHYQQLLMQIPYWRGESLNGKTLLILAEQGIGDEIVASNCFIDAIQASQHCIISCDPRLEKLYTQTFTAASIYGTSRKQQPWQNEKIDYVCLTDTLLYYFRKTANDFPTTKGWLKLNERRVQYWRDQLKALPNGVKVGIAWRSMKARHPGSFNNTYLTLDELAPLLLQPEVQFVNLQYDNVNDEISSVEKKYNIKIHQLEGLDVMNNFYELAHCLYALDLSLVPLISTHALAGAVGADFFIFEPTLATRNFCGLEKPPFFSYCNVYKKTDFNSWKSTIKNAKTDFNQFIENRQHDIN